MVTARQEPRLVLISLTCEGEALTLSAAYTKDLLLPIKAPATNAVYKCRVHGLEIEGRDCGEAAAQWITSFLKTQPYRLVHYEPHMRLRNSHQIKDVFQPTDQIVYSDASPFLILSEASLADLNSRLEKKVKVANFRPNIVISGCGVYAEDSWDELLIGDVILKRVMACSRCVLTTVDPDTGVMSRKEPLETLKSYRLCDPSEQKLYGKSPLFGQYFVLENPGTINVGDPVYLLGQEREEKEEEWASVKNVLEECNGNDTALQIRLECHIPFRLKSWTTFSEDMETLIFRKHLRHEVMIPWIILDLALLLLRQRPQDLMDPSGARSASGLQNSRHVVVESQLMRTAIAVGL
ncbi:mitochondrial amidoxime-reducing component 1 isoform X1 [Crocuta crocuta]